MPAGIGDAEPEWQEEAEQPASEHANAAIAFVNVVSKEVDDMAAIVGGFTHPLPTDLAPLPGSADSQG